jgi:uncharacterized repeat protein (TIGR03803 family)
MKTLASAVLFSLGAFCCSAKAGGYHLVFSLAGQNNFAQGGLAVVGNTLYGTSAVFGGNACVENNVGCGTVFSVTPLGTSAELYYFDGSLGGVPRPGLLKMGDLLLGTAYQGGSDGCPFFGYNLGCGTVFSITPGGKTNLIYAFGGGSDGAHPVAGLTRLGNLLYGTTLAGGTFGGGVVYAVTLNGKEKTLHSFGAKGDGSAPSAGLIAVENTLYGTTSVGGAYGQGTVFSILPNGTEKVVYSFKGGTSDGAVPKAPLKAVGTFLLGTTTEGGANGAGTIFMLTPLGHETVWQSFGAGKDGGYPSSGLAFCSVGLCGLTNAGGAFGAGVLYAITTRGTAERVWHNFGGFDADGESPDGELIELNNVLYGVTASGGANGGGAVFSYEQ